MAKYIIATLAVDGSMVEHNVHDWMKKILIEEAYRSNDKISSVMSFEYVMEHAFFKFADTPTKTVACYVFIDVVDPDDIAFLTLMGREPAL
jgi:hypothetical protein